MLPTAPRVPVATSPVAPATVTTDAPASRVLPSTGGQASQFASPMPLGVATDAPIDVTVETVLVGADRSTVRYCPVGFPIDGAVCHR